MTTLHDMTEQCARCGDTLEQGQIGFCDDCQGDGQHEYAFDLELATALRVMAATEDEARAKLAAHLDCLSANLGELDGKTLVAEVSLKNALTLYEIDGEPAT